MASYCPELEKQSGEKWFPQTYNVVGRVAGTLLLKTKLIHGFLAVVSAEKDFPVEFDS